MSRKTEHTRQTLLQRICDVDNAHAWYEFVYYYRGYIYGILKKMEISHHDAEEIVQQVLLKIAKKIDSFEYDPTIGRFRGYLARITVNTARNHFRSIHPSISLDEHENIPGMLEKTTGEPELDQLAEDEWNQHLYRIAWRNVSIAFGENVKNTWDKLCQGMPPEEIAKELNIPRGSVYVYKKRIMEKMEPEIKRLKSELE